ncbi:MAG: hypothetical protein A2236_03505 [Bacteroidetes bacterium RIFOXYA2_FULL_33_7]|nr:MAG: hypothetical protein A2236_03505 [Bacteroidetes bacterium RIFOXYA2_FULL_33_7]
MSKYWDYAKGNIVHSQEHKAGTPFTPANFSNNRMPLWIKPDAKINVHQVMDFMRDHLEGTELDMRKDIGAGPFGNPYRWRPLTFKIDGKEYCNERATATQQTGFSFVTQSRALLPKEVGGIFWFSVDDAASTVYFPMYTSAIKIPEAYAVGNGTIMDFTLESAFWVFNMVSNYSYTNFSLIWPDIRKKQLLMEQQFISDVATIDKKAGDLLQKGEKENAIKLLTEFSVNKGNYTHKEWLKLYGELFAKYMDGNVKVKSEPKEGYKYVTPKLEQPGYGEAWYKRIVNETGEQFLMKGSSH